MEHDVDNPPLQFSDSATTRLSVRLARKLTTIRNSVMKFGSKPPPIAKLWTKQSFSKNGSIRLVSICHWKDMRTWKFLLLSQSRFCCFLKRFFGVKAYNVQIRQSSPGSQCPVSKLCPPYDFRYTKNMALSPTTNSTVTSTTETGEISFKLLFPS